MTYHGSPACQMPSLLTGQRSTPPAQKGSQIVREWWFLGGPQEVPVKAEQWCPYDQDVQHHLSLAFDAMKMEGCDEGKVLDLRSFTNRPLPYQIWKGTPYSAVNKSDPKTFGRSLVAGLDYGLWCSPSEFPPSAKHGKVIGGFYQVHEDHASWIEGLNRYLMDASSSPFPFPECPRRRVVILIEIEKPAFASDPDRFRGSKKKSLPPQPALIAGAHEAVPYGEAVFQWWVGNFCDPSASGYWMDYPPHVSAQLEEALAKNNQFSACLEPIAIDEVRYDLQRISTDRPFDYVEQNTTERFREPFLPEHIITVFHAPYDEQTRLTNNCFVQFQRGNPFRRRAVRRIRRSEAAGLADPRGEPSGACFSEVDDTYRPPSRTTNGARHSPRALPSVYCLTKGSARRSLSAAGDNTIRGASRTRRRDVHYLLNTRMTRAWHLDEEIAPFGAAQQSHNTNMWHLVGDATISGTMTPSRRSSASLSSVSKEGDATTSSTMRLSRRSSASSSCASRSSSKSSLPSLK